MPRLRVLVSAYAVSPVRGSEPGLGWNIVSRLARWHNVTVLCTPAVPGSRDENFREEITRYLADHGPIHGLTFQYIEPPLLSRWFQRETFLRRRTTYYIGYNAWQKAAYRVALELHRKEPFQLVHHLNITGYREPGYLWRLPIPFVWGPIGGAADVPKEYFKFMSWKDQLYYGLRNTLNTLQKRKSSRCRAAARAAHHIWVVGEENYNMVSRQWGYPAESVIESGAAVCQAASPRRYQPGRPLRLVWSGQHIGRKALPLLLHALKQLRYDQKRFLGMPDIKTVILGAGPETSRWKQMAAHLGIDDGLVWTGSLSHQAALDEVAQSDALVHTSIQENTSLVVLEALSMGVPVICHDACGMSVAVNDQCGIKVPMTNPDTSIAGFVTAIHRLATEPELLEYLSRGAIARAEELSWDKSALHIAEQYGRTYLTTA